MQPAPIPENEESRLLSLKKLRILDTPPEERFDRITKIATSIFNVPISTITLIDSNREWHKSVCGLDDSEGDRAISFCGHALLEDEALIIPDATKDVRFSDNPMVISAPFIRFYAGVPLFSADGTRIGTFCIKGHEPKKLTETEKETLKAMAHWVEVEINQHDLSLAINQLKETTEEIDTFFETSQDFMVIANTKGYFEKVNPSVLRTLGYTNEEIKKNSFYSFIHPDDQGTTRKEIQLLATGTPIVNFNNRFKTKEGQYLWLQWSATPRKSKLYAVARDITELKERQLEMEKINKYLIDRELKMVELKETIRRLKQEKNENTL